MGRVGNLILHENAVNIKGVVVKAKRPSFKKGNEGMIVEVQHSDFAKLGNALDVLREMPRLNVSNNGEISVFGKGTPIVYINNKLVNDIKVLQCLKSEDIKNVEIITTPGAKYNATASAVVRVQIVRKQGEGWSGTLATKGAYNGEISGNEQVDLSFHHKGLELFCNLQLASTLLKSNTGMSQQVGNSQSNTIQQSNLDNQSGNLDNPSSILVNQQVNLFSCYNWTDATIGFSYDINDLHSLGASYEVFKSISHNGNASGWQEIKKQDNLFDVISQTMDYGDNNGPDHEANLYYAGTIGKLKIDFDASYLWRKAISRMMETENANHLDSRLIHTCNNSRNQMLAGKLVLSFLVGKGTVEFGGEITSTHSRGSYVNDEKYVAPSSTLVKENNVASFFTWRYPLGDLEMAAGLRYEYVNTDYYSFGEYQAEPSRTYGNWFPNFSLSWNKGLWNASLNYICKTSRPSYNNLRSEIQYNNRYLYEGGNPYLRPSISNDVSLDMVYSWFSFGLEYEYLDKPMMWCGSLYDGKNIAFVHYLNFSCKHELSFYSVASPKLGWYNPTLQIFLVKPFMGRTGEHVDVSLDNPSLVVTWNNKIAFSSSFTGWLTIRGNTYSCQDFVRLKPAYSMSVRMVKTLFHDALKLNLYANDLFGTRKDKWMMYGDGMILAKDAYNYTREVGLQVSYTFNAMKSKYKGSGAGAFEKERL